MWNIKNLSNYPRRSGWGIDFLCTPSLPSFCFQFKRIYASSTHKFCLYGFSIVSMAISPNIRPCFGSFINDFISISLQSLRVFSLLQPFAEGETQWTLYYFVGDLMRFHVSAFFLQSHSKRRCLPFSFRLGPSQFSLYTLSIDYYHWELREPSHQAYTQQANTNNSSRYSSIFFSFHSPMVISRADNQRQIRRRFLHLCPAIGLHQWYIQNVNGT